MFFSWLTQCLLPVLSKGDVIVMDNASFHKAPEIKEVIEASGCKLEFLPSYSPDLNPIEHKWAEAKATRRQYRCDVDELFSMNFWYDKL